VVTPIKKPENKGFLNKLKFWEKDEAELAKEAAEKEAAEKSAAAKARREEAKAIAKDSAAKQAESISAQEEEKSILVVPIEVPAAAPTATESLEVPATLAPSVVPAVETQPAQISPPEVKPAAAPAPVADPAESQVYDPSSGMQFDRKLQSEAEGTEATAKPAVVEPRAGNKVPPAPRELPEEGDISTFDRILEQIGF
jgi:outer membrane protein assembly factor BamE